MNADKAIFTAGLVTIGSTVSSGVLPTSMGGTGKLPGPKLFIGTGLTFTGLSILGDIAPNLAVPLAASVAITALIYYGIPVLDRSFTEKHQAVTPANQAAPDSTVMASLNNQLDAIEANPVQYLITNPGR